MQAQAGHSKGGGYSLQHSNPPLYPLSNEERKTHWSSHHSICSEVLPTKSRISQGRVQYQMTERSGKRVESGQGIGTRAYARFSNTHLAKEGNGTPYGRQNKSIHNYSIICILNHYVDSKFERHNVEW